MYRLLIVTENQSVRDLFTAMEGWESMGFKPPPVSVCCAESASRLRGRGLAGLLKSIMSILRTYQNHPYRRLHWDARPTGFDAAPARTRPAD